MKIIPIVLLGFCSFAYSARLTHDSSLPPPIGSKGYARFTLRDSDRSLITLPPRSQLLTLHEGSMEILSPIDDLRQLDALGALSHEATGQCGSMDYFPLNYSLSGTVAHSVPYFSTEAHFTDLETLLKEVQLDSLRATITTLSNLPSRFHRHSTGQNASETLTQIWKAQLQTTDAWQIKEFPHTNTPQRSVIARLEGETPDAIVLGAHLDSIGSRTNAEAVSPGADDDASGIAILTEILRIIEKNHLRFHRSIELQGYAAEEVGLVGSREIAANYRTTNKSVDAMLQFDMAYYSRPGDEKKMFFLEDFTALDLTRSGVQLTKAYLEGAYTRGFIPKGASSDHKAWFEQGYPTLFPFENPEADNPYIHTIEDTMGHFDDGSRIQQMVKFGLLFLAYQAGLETLDAPYQTETARLIAREIPKDLYVALQATEGTAYAFAVSAPLNTAFLEFCTIDVTSDYRCQSTRDRLTLSEERSGRKVFYVDARAFAADEKWRLEAYDAADELIARRHIQWQIP